MNLSQISLTLAVTAQVSLILQILQVLPVLPLLPAHADDQFKAVPVNPVFMEETVSTPEIENDAAKSLYGAYSSIYYQRYAQADKWIRYGQYKAPGEVYRALLDGDYLLTVLNSEAAKRKFAAVQASSFEFQILKALMQEDLGDKQEALEMLKRVAINFPQHAAITALKVRIKALEYEQSLDPWDTPPDVVRSGGRKNEFSKWRFDKFPLKVYIPTDSESSNVKGYKDGDSQMVKASFDLWQRLNGGKIKFVYVPKKTNADITCAWASEQKELKHEHAVGLCTTYSKDKVISKAEILILTFSDPIFYQDLQYRKQTLTEIILHEIGHSLGLNHSTSEDDVMTYHIHAKPLSQPTNRDLSSLKTLYFTNIGDMITAAVDCVDRENFKQAVATLDKIIALNPKDGQTRDTVCICLRKIANHSIYKEDYQSGIKYLLKAKSFFDGTETKKVKDSIIRKLTQAYLKTGNLKAVNELEQQQGVKSEVSQTNSASFLDQYGLRPDSIPHYEKALAENPDDLAIREKFCFLLVTLAKDEMRQQKYNEAIPILVRAKEMLRAGMPKSTFDKIIHPLRSAYLTEHRYDEADNVWKGVTELLPKEEKSKYSSEAALAELISGSKRIHREWWLTPSLAKSQTEEIKSNYEKYVDALRQCGAAAKVRDEPTWATVLIVRAKKYDRPGAPEPFAKMFALRHRLMELVPEGALVSAEIGLPLKNEETKN